MPGENILEIRDVVSGYASTLPILNGISLDVREGEIVTLLGPNGAGKSTLIKTVAGILKIWSGTAHFLGRDLTKFETHNLVREGLGYVPQTENVFAKLSVEENLEIGCFVNRKEYPRQRQRIFDLFPGSGASAFACGREAFGWTASNGSGRPRPDGPTRSFSCSMSLRRACRPSWRRFVFAQLLKVRDAGVTILMVEQNARAALQISDRGYNPCGRTRASSGRCRIAARQS